MSQVMAGVSRCLVFIVMVPWFLLLSASPARGQTPREIPYAGYSLHDERAVGPFTVQRWVSSESPEVSPAGMCECITVVYQGERLVVSLGAPREMTARQISDLTGQDINRDGEPELIVSEWSGGAHCCYTTTIYSAGTEAARQIFSRNTGNCGPGGFEDLDGDGALEFVTCDDGWAYTYCSFADSPFPRVVYAYDIARGEYAPATPRFTSRFRDELAAALDEAQAWMAESNGKDGSLDKCRLLKPVLGLMFAGRIDDGLVLIRGLYRGADREVFEKETVDKVRQSPQWVPR
jgi:hypothetical protein